MAGLLFYQVSLSLLAELILVVSIVLYLLTLRQKSQPTWLLIATFSGFAWHSLMACLTHLLDPASVAHFYVIRLEPLGLLVQQIALVQFAYVFPEPIAGQRREAMIVLAISTLLALFGLGWTATALFRYRDNGSVALVDLMTASQLLWTVVVLARHTIRLSFKAAAPADGSNTFVAGLRRLFKPNLKQAKATRAFALAYLFSILLLVLAVLADVDVISAAVSNLLVAPGILVFLFAFFIVYVNYAPRPTTFMVKLVGISLVMTLSVLGMTGFLVAPFYEASYTNSERLADQQTLRFEPAAGGYRVEAVPFQFEAELGQKLTLGNDSSLPLNLGFDFPFYDQPQTTAYISDNGLITFDGDFDLANFEYHLQPAIAPFVIDLNPEAGGGIFARSEPEQVIITWSQVPETVGGQPDTFQLVLHADGVFEITYNGLNPAQLYSVFNPLQAVWLTGIFPGHPADPPDQLLAADLPLQTTSSGGLIADYYLAFRREIGRQMLPLAYLVLAAGLIILLGFPFFFQTSLVSPLNSLVEGVRQVNRGNLNIEVPVQYLDEVGFVTRSFNRMVQSIKRADRLKDEFLANTSHELRTPLNGIIGLAESMLDGAAGPLSPEQAHNLTMIVSDGRRLANLVNDLLDFSRLKSQAINLQLKPTDLYGLTQVVLTLSEALVGSKPLKLENRISPDLPPVMADENRIQQIMYNLIGNAIKFTHSGRVTVTAAIENRPGQGQVMAVAVTDTGIGIAPAQQERIFESFEQADGSIEREYGGTGLGLAITKQLVELHSGTIGVESAEGQGSTFTFTLPLNRSGLPVPTTDTLATQPMASRDFESTVGWVRPAVEPENEAPLPQSPFKSMGNGLHDRNGAIKILIVDDEPINLQVLKNQLTLHNFNVTLSSNGIEALQLVADETTPDLVLLDVMMPRMSGYEVCRRLRQQYSLSELPILMLTAKDQIDDVVVGFQAGANDYLTKPFHKDELLVRITTLITLKQAVRDHDLLLAVQQELDIAHRIQESLLPLPRPTWPGVDVVCYSSPAREVGGDLYAYHLHTNGDPINHPEKYVVAVGDVSGKGMPAALLMAISLSSFRLIAEQGLGPGSFLAKMDTTLSDYTRSRRQNCAMVYVELSQVGAKTDEFSLRTANAGCIPPLIKRRSGSVEWIDVGGVPLGLGFGAKAGYQERSLTLSRGDLLILISDGLVEAFSERREMLGFERLEAMVAQLPPASAEEILHRLRTMVEAFVQGANPHDDLTIVVIQV